MAGRAQFRKRDFASAAAYETSIAPNCERLQRILRAVDKRVSPVRMDYVSSPDQPALRVFAVR